MTQKVGITCPLCGDMIFVEVAVDENGDIIPEQTLEIPVDHMKHGSWGGEPYEERQ